ncbi:helix-turn-helix transcriptional regulator [Pseudomonas putida CSV86]|uniref:Helix-turn-helix transcriptional regulator n=1 Tax=Pseudomonas bharatica CSV86 TaxID=1005395 RepID=A0A7K4E9I3_9PSED|nr:MULTISPECIES: helix-turn-helix transcriptional regulator [Pseudomonas]MDG9883087.1 helix-turn-helix transcriptional regulator [Pseudomonas sp. GD04058]NNJ14315.1 helix-turn-helix transcriptional regulator [Pseudomonas bharatica CSV86]
MAIQVISRDGQPEYAVVPWDQYQALLKAAGQPEAVSAEAQTTTEAASSPASVPSLSRLAVLREAKGIPAEQLARKVGISPAYLAMIESGERVPDSAIRRSLAWELGLSGWSDPS